ncbi:MAG: LL-diaminopimelate aminotransferase [Bacteroidaceae bacterium]|nr:LL-diaminopimelate aminotransferase [Bacteroidaceae bacterium]
MLMVNENYIKLPGAYLFVEIAHKVKAFKAGNPDAKVISLGIGDVTRPLCPAVVKALHTAADEMASAATFRGYGPERGYDFLREAIVVHDFRERGIDIEADEVFVSDGAKSDTGNFQELLAPDVRIAVTDPVYPVYVDSNVMGGRAGVLGDDGRWSDVVYLPCTAENGFVPDLPKQKVDVVYLCYPNNPTGTTLTREQLQRWVDYAIRKDVLIFYDAAYEAYIQSADVPHSIYEIAGARTCAVEFHSYSKTAGFTGVRCGYTVVPKDVKAKTSIGERIALNPLWNRRQSTKFNGTSYLAQRAAEAIYTPEGERQVRATINYYMENARLMRKTLMELGLKVYGGVDAPYLWVRIPDGATSWQFFDVMLRQAHVVCTPGVGFGPSGEGYVRLTAFGNREQTIEALGNINKFMSF